MAVLFGPGISIGGGISVVSEGAPAGYATGGTVVDIAGYRVHIFNASDTFATTASWPSGLTIEYLVVAGGGGADSGAGGAGGLLSASGVTGVATTNYAVTIGAGGIGANGGDSSLIGGALSVTATGGGSGGDGTGSNGADGGSGGGGGTDTSGTNGTGGAGITGQGNSGGDAAGKASTASSGWGGGAGAAGNSPGLGAGLESNMIVAYSSSTITLSPYINDWYTYTFTVPSGLGFQFNTAIYIENSTDSTLNLFGCVTSYSGTTLVCNCSRETTDDSAHTLAGWNIKYAHAGGGVGYAERSFPYAAKRGGGGGVYNPDDLPGLPNSGGGGGVATHKSGGSGVVMIKYAYP